MNDDLDATPFHNAAALWVLRFLLLESNSGILWNLWFYFSVLASSCFTNECILYLLQMLLEMVVKVKVAKPATAGNLSMLKYRIDIFCICKITNLSSLSGTYKTVFDFCVGRSRHSSESVVHENAYHSKFHHCFSLTSNASG
ncbi:hypothetical protein F2Q69_00004829 [Brassica cretica]|uniref:SREBP regulating gene protein n=1 Tax=Brassica cretica TaxID=69181 RepID=A0A8S9PEX0_BRACR|nr:hypothetical protein F2Q69_00004829 [Brassica cretica]